MALHFSQFYIESNRIGIKGKTNILVEKSQRTIGKICYETIEYVEFTGLRGINREKNDESVSKTKKTRDSLFHVHRH